MSPPDLRKQANAKRAALKRIKHLLDVFDEQLPNVRTAGVRAELLALRQARQHEYEEHEADLAAMDAILAAESSHLSGRQESSNVFSEHMTAATLRERNIKISRNKSSSPLAEACRAAGLTKNDLARKLNMSAGSLVAYEQGRTVPAIVLRKIRSLTKSKMHPEGFADFPNTQK